MPLFGTKPNSTVLEDIDLNERDVDEILVNLNTGKSPGNDGIHAELLTELRTQLKKPFTIMCKK